MTAEIVNLRRIRKEKARADDKRAAEANRAAFGRTKAEKSVTKAAKDAADRKLDGHRRED
ncbi:MAG: DUF4169 family protein [Bauldia sp.]|nr:DUF4169 family protein [Bauldia sp.]MCW5717325.1 DUF4169 family protein [Bauldia sp.]